MKNGVMKQNSNRQYGMINRMTTFVFLLSCILCIRVMPLCAAEQGGSYEESLMLEPVELDPWEGGDAQKPGQEPEEGGYDMEDGEDSDYEGGSIDSALEAVEDITPLDDAGMSPYSGEEAVFTDEVPDSDIDLLHELPLAIPGDIEYFEGEQPSGDIIAIDVISLDHIDSPGIVIMTTSAMEVFRFNKKGRLAREWKGDFVKSFTRRGTTAEVYAGTHKGRRMVFVSMNRFSKSFAYRWDMEERALEKAGRVNSYMVDLLPMQSVYLMADYGEGIISRDGGSTHFVEAGSAEPEKTGFPVPEDYYSGCIMRWTRVSAELARIAVVTETGAVKVFQGPSKLMARTEPRYGGQLVCGPVTPSGGLLFTTTMSDTDDAVVLLSYSNNEIVEKWRTGPLGGAVVQLTGCDLDKNGETELLGVLETNTGRQIIFRLLPDYGKSLSDPADASVNIIETEHEAEEGTD